MRAGKQPRHWGWKPCKHRAGGAGRAFPPLWGQGGLVGHTHTAGTREQRGLGEVGHGEEPVVNELCGTQIKAQVCGLRKCPLALRG